MGDEIDNPAQSSRLRRISRRRKWLFRFVAVTLALSPILIGEMICRFAGYGGYPPVLKRMKAYRGTQYVGTFQPGLNTFFWQTLSATGGMEEHVFVTPKPKGRTRIMTFGGSAMRGFPQPRPLVSTSFLQAMLEDVWPDRDIEILNFGTTAVASFPVMYILDEALEYEPDLVIIYSGNNEFYGACGVASLHAFGKSTWSMRAARAMRKTGLGQWIAEVSTRSAAATPADSKPAKSLMESVIADGQIGPDDSRRAAAADNLRNHLTSMVEACKSRGIPVIICTLPANERDMAPLGQDFDLPPEESVSKRFVECLAVAERLVSETPADAVQPFEVALSLNPRHARAHYELARCYSVLGRDDDALANYEQAQELDPMPWRAPGSLSAVVRDVASESGAILCDLVRTFRAASPDGAIGWELMDDHVHPTLQGQALIAESLLKCMTQLTGSVRVDPEPIETLSDWRAYAKALGENEYDRFGVQHRMRTLFRAPFYAESNPDALARAERLCAEYRMGFSESELGAIKFWQDPQTHSGGFRPITGFVGAVLMSEGEFQKADRVLSIARRSVAEYSLWNLELTWRVLMARRRLHASLSPADIALAKEMIEDGETMYRATGIRSPELCRHLGMAYHLIGDHKRAIADLNKALEFVVDMSGFDVVQGLVDSLVQTGQTDKAIRVLKSPIKDPQLAHACRSLLTRVESRGP